MLLDIYTKLKQRLLIKLNAFTQSFTNTNAYKCSKNNIFLFFKKKKVCDCIRRGEITKVPLLLGSRNVLPNERKISHMK